MASASSTAESDRNSQTVFVAEVQRPDDSDSSGVAAAMTVDELVKGSWPAEPRHPAARMFAGRLGGPRTAEKVWEEIEEKRECVGTQEMREMTLEDFLAKAGVMVDGGVEGPAAACGTDVAVGGVGRFMKRSRLPDGREHVVRTNRKAAAALAEPVDRAAQQRQRRMIKNRESAARSRERKLAYTMELVSAVSQLKEENTKLVREQMEQKKKRYKQLMENVIPVVEGRRPRRILRRASSMQW